MYYRITTVKCKGCGLCVLFCPKKIIAMSKEVNDRGYHYATIREEDKSQCTICMNCAIMCPDFAIEIWDKTK